MARNWNKRQSAALLGKCFAYKSMGYELILIHAEEVENYIHIDYKVQKEGVVESISVKVPQGRIIPSVTEVFPQGAQMQREIALNLPLQFNEEEGKKTSGKGYSLIEWGPYHPLLPEPVKFQISMHDEVIDRVWVETGYNCRGIESLCIGQKAEDTLTLLERISSANGIPMELAFVSAIEKINGIKVSEKAGWLRMILNEMNALQANLQGLNYTAQCLGMMADSARIFKLICLYREAVEHISEHPLFFGMVKPGGLNRDISRDKLYAVNAVLQEMEDTLVDMKNRWRGTASIQKRLNETGMLDEAMALRLTGRLTRAAGNPYDSRKYSSLPYNKLSYTIPVYKESNCFARIMLKLDDLLQSLDLIDQAVGELPEGETSVSVKTDGDGEVLVREPEVYGEIVMWVKQQKGHIASLKIRDASTLHIPFLPGCLKGMELNDLPLIVSSLDFDFSGMEK